MRRILLFAFVPLFSAYAQDLSKVHFVRASGEATVTAKPDRAQISIGVVTRAPTAQAASAQNAQETMQVIQSLKSALGTNGNVRTTGYSISPQFDYSNQGHPPKVTGYEASNTVLVTEDDLPALGKVIDAATSAGANNINGISFMLRDDTAIRQKALVEATEKARANAETIARALNLHVTGVLQAEPTEMPVFHPMPTAMLASAKAMPTPIESGSLDVNARVTVVLQVE